jgi:MoaA/NifB/PqqE/SkfB family radical SAM enzyme
MARIVIELTNRCTLRCQHCFSGRHGGRDDLPLVVLDQLLADADGCGFDHFTFTGGDPTLHPQFGDILRRTADAGYRFSFVTNGWNFIHIYPAVLPHRTQLRVITFSLDGATEATHDRLRGAGSYRRVLQAMSVCIAVSLPFSINMVVTTHNRHELAPMALLAERLGSHGLRFGHLMPAPLTTAQGFDLSSWERKLVEAEIGELRAGSKVPIGMAPGFHTTTLFPCAPLNLEEVNVDCQGNLTTCCHLSSHGPGVGQGDVIADLRHTRFRDAYQELVAENARFKAAKRRHLASGAFRDEDFFPCWYCSVHYAKVDWLRQVPGHAWGDLLDESAAVPCVALPSSPLIQIGGVPATR